MRNCYVVHLIKAGKIAGQVFPKDGLFTLEEADSFADFWNGVHANELDKAGTAIVSQVAIN